MPRPHLDDCADQSPIASLPVLWDTVSGLTIPTT